MSNNTNLLLNWLKTFQTVWLPENLPNDNHLLQSIKTKLNEFEQIIIGKRISLLPGKSSFRFMFLENNDDEEEYHRARLLNDHSPSNSDTEAIPIASTSTHDIPIGQSLNLLLHQSGNENEEEQARQILLEQSDDDDDESILLRPSIRLKRISQSDAERFMPLAWKNENVPTETRKDESSTSSSTSDDDSDYNIKYRTRSSVSKKTEKSTIQSHKQPNKSHKKSNDVFINYNPSAMLDEPSLEDSITIAQDISPMDEDRLLQDVIENNDNDSIFASLDITHDKPMETNPIEEIVDASNDRLSTTQDSTDDR